MRKLTIGRRGRIKGLLCAAVAPAGTVEALGAPPAIPALKPTHGVTHFYKLIECDFPSLRLPYMVELPIEEHPSFSHFDEDGDPVFTNKEQ